MRKRFLDPYLMLNQSEVDGGGGTPEPKADGPDPAESVNRAEFNFPDDSPVSGMTPEQQAEYWRHKARRHESRAKAFGDMTPEQVQKLIEEREEARKKGLSDAERAVEEARAAERKDISEASAKREAETALKIALRGRFIDGEAAFSRPDFVKDGSADVDAILAWVEENSQPSRSGGGSNSVIPGQGTHERVVTNSRAAGKAEAEKRFGKKS